MTDVRMEKQLRLTADLVRSNRAEARSLQDRLALLAAGAHQSMTYQRIAEITGYSKHRIRQMVAVGRKGAA